jgi:hypothetical protein
MIVYIFGILFVKTAVWKIYGEKYMMQGTTEFKQLFTLSLNTHDFNAS